MEERPTATRTKNERKLSMGSRVRHLGAAAAAAMGAGAHPET